ncbi:vWA domain-containing protein [Bhargavaea cecembensis]|uniref:vWA domain-containing protein n=1 Tax=Bhargavaea cecembensis TaxID=394098 RepID=UPI00058C9366|nr:VWA domain-containing protein [Bhargavaea cecembensis]
MTSIRRFIDFNDEQIDAEERLRHERLARALAGDPEIRLTERKLLEYSPANLELAMSVFWRHRPDEIQESGRLSDIYLLASGFWTGFDLSAWRSFTGLTEDSPIREFLRQTVLMIEELRLSDLIMKERPGTKKAFGVRRKAYAEFHKAQLPVNLRHGFRADALFNHFFLALNGFPDAEGEEEFGNLTRLSEPILFHAFDARSTGDSVNIAARLMPVLESRLGVDLVHSYYSLGESLGGGRKDFHYHRGVKTGEAGEEEEKESIRELFRTWHDANRSEKGPHLDYELEHGRTGRSDSAESREGREGMEVTSTGRGRSAADERTGVSQSKPEAGQEGIAAEWKKATGFGSENESVIYREKVAEPDRDPETLLMIRDWRMEAAPYVRAVEREMKKRIEKKREDRREGLSAGRLSGNPTDIVLSERPKPFYRKQRPSKRLDAVFGLLVDGSGSMVDKLPETRKAVLLFHDVLNSLGVRHGIASYQEDAGTASKASQPNEFLWLHSFRDEGKDDASRIMSLEAGDDNRDGFAIRWMTKRLEQMQEHHKFLLIFTDGEPSAFGYGQNGIVDTAEAVNEAEKRGIIVIHLFLSAHPVDERQHELFRMMYGNRSATAESLGQFSEETVRILRKLLALAASSE